ncbi:MULTISPECIES: hypothetical protein [unclassified Variovorax]|uniref:hypothetical protein n=1 Tax=unclassified Variovorax TaxID=663243 RepID=UPI001160AC1E|nr:MULTISPECIES: hypothetical protein [unclassified Variovorax]
MNFFALAARSFSGFASRQLGQRPKALAFKTIKSQYTGQAAPFDPLHGLVLVLKTAEANFAFAP